MSFTQTGRLHEIFDEQQVSEKFRKREFVLELEGQYLEHVKFQLTQDKCGLLDKFQFGDEVSVTFNLRGRGYNKDGQMLYFNNLEAWKLEPHGNTPNRQAAIVNEPKQQLAPHRDTQSQQQAPAPVGGDDNDLPF